jgi:parallel beta-helix repeat protein
MGIQMFFVDQIQMENVHDLNQRKRTSFYNAFNVTISDCDIEEIGLYITLSERISIRENYFTTYYDGLRFYYSKDILIKDNSFSCNQGGIAIVLSSNTTIEDNHFVNTGDISFSPDALIDMYSSSNIMVTDNTLSNSWGGITFSSSDNITIRNNDISNLLNGITSVFSSHIIIQKNDLHSNNETGIKVEHSDDVIILNNIISNNSESEGIRLENLNVSYIAQNEISYTKNGIFLEDSARVLLSNNTLNNNRYGFYLKMSRDCIIEDNYIIDNEHGAYLNYISRFAISCNNVSNNVYGIYLFQSKENDITDNSIYSNSKNGIRIYFSPLNLILGNMVHGNGYGLSLSFSDSNTIHHNRFINNTNQIELMGSIGIWDDANGEGNYWSDYEGKDKDGDGVGDTAIPHLGVDFNPLCEPNKEEENIFSFLFERRTLSNFIFIGIIIFLILILVRRIRNLFETSSKVGRFDDIEPEDSIEPKDKDSTAKDEDIDKIKEN